MRKIVAIVAVAVMMMTCLPGCKAKETAPEVPDTAEKTAEPEQTEETPEEGTVVGGWTVPEYKAELDLEDDAEDSFEDVYGENGSMKAVAYLGSQVVAGRNFAYLAADQNNGGKLCLVRIYRDLEGNSSVLSVDELNVADYTGSSDIQFSPEGFAGGWNNDGAYGVALDKDAEEAFTKATEGLMGVGYEPVALMGTQVVAGINYAFLCKARLISPDNENTALAVMIVYKDLEGNATVNSICGFEFPEIVGVEVEDAPTVLEGGWNYPEDWDDDFLTEDQEEVFELAEEKLLGVDYDPIAFLGVQVVSGLNYAYLCESEVVAPGAQKKLAVVKVYKDLDGNVEILDVKDFELAAFTEKEDVVDMPADAVGGWETENAKGSVIPAEALEKFNLAAGGMLGVKYDPIVLLGTQLVAGTNYAFLCKATTVTEEPQVSLAVVIVYADLEGNAEFTVINGFGF